MSAEAERKIDELWHALMDPVPSQSALRMPGEGVVGSPIQLVRNIDGMTHPMLVEFLARLGDPREINRLHIVAANTEPTRQEDAALAATILDRISSGDPQMVTNPAASVQPTPQAVAAASTPGQLLGQAYDALAGLRLNAALPVDVKAPLDALITVLSSYPKETP